MANDFDLRRLTDKLTKLSEEQTKLNQLILKSRRDEQSELNYIRRRFNAQIRSLEEKQKRVIKETTAYERRLHTLQEKIQEERDEQLAQSKSETNFDNYRRRRI